MSTQRDSSQQLQTEKEIQKQEQSQRMLGVVPMFQVTSRHTPPPLTLGQKFRLTYKAALDPFQWVAAGFEAGLGQATDEFHQYGQGAAGYGKRVGAALADEGSSQFFGSFSYPVLLKEDPRYFRRGEGSTGQRIYWALEQEFICHTDRGNRRFAFSNVLGALTAGSIANAYYPPNNRGFGLTMSRSAIALAYGSAGGIIDEFWPDIQRKFFHKQPKIPQAP